MTNCKTFWASWNSLFWRQSWNWFGGEKGWTKTTSSMSRGVKLCAVIDQSFVFQTFMHELVCTLRITFIILSTIHIAVSVLSLTSCIYVLGTFLTSFLNRFDQPLTFLTYNYKKASYRFLIQAVSSWLWQIEIAWQVYVFRIFPSLATL